MYPGNKKNGSEPILEILNNPKLDGMNYLEPFVGMGHILRRMENKQNYLASDLSPYAYHVLTAIKNHGRFPNITKPVYLYFKANRYLPRNSKSLKLLKSILHPQDFEFEYEELEAFAALATFRSQPWATYQGNASDGESQNWKKQREEEYRLLLQSDVFFKTEIVFGDYIEYPIDIMNTVIYCDIPYSSSKATNKIHYGDHAKNFDYETFWNRVRTWSSRKLNNFVFVSEYHAPSDFITVTQFEKRGVTKLNVEKLFMTKESYQRWKSK